MDKYGKGSQGIFRTYETCNTKETTISPDGSNMFQFDLTILATKELA
jgi:hypothetical protein